MKSTVIAGLDCGNHVTFATDFCIVTLCLFEMMPISPEPLLIMQYFSALSVILAEGIAERRANAKASCIPNLILAISLLYFEGEIDSIEYSQLCDHGSRAR
eukprot:scpid110350/ scgid34543/ 